jgi:hypothetical protein
MKVMNTGGLRGALESSERLSPVNARGARKRDQAGAKKTFSRAAFKNFRA